MYASTTFGGLEAYTVPYADDYIVPAILKKRCGEPSM